MVPKTCFVIMSFCKDNEIMEHKEYSFDSKVDDFTQVLDGCVTLQDDNVVLIRFLKRWCLPPRACHHGYSSFAGHQANQEHHITWGPFCLPNVSVTAICGSTRQTRVALSARWESLMELRWMAWLLVSIYSSFAITVQYLVHCQFVSPIHSTHISIYLYGLCLQNGHVGSFKNHPILRKIGFDKFFHGANVSSY